MRVTIFVNWSMASTYTPPSANAEKFTCSHCGTYSAQEESLVMRATTVTEHGTNDDHEEDGDFIVRVCHQCENLTIWYKSILLYPDGGIAPLPNPDLPDNIKADYLEAASIAGKSPRGAAALLRLCLQNLCIFLGEPGKDINTDIATMVKKGLPKRIQQAFDVVRIMGNESVHPGTLDLNEKPEVAAALFKLINLIVDDRITQPKEIEDVYNTLPESKRKAIEKRDGA